MNLPELISFEGGSIEYHYDASGVKWKKIISKDGVTRITDYIGGIEFVNGEISSVSLGEGRAVKTDEGWNMEYVIRDHLGNTRIAFSDLNGDGSISKLKSDGEILQEHHIYPFGMSWESSAQSPWYRHPKVDEDKDNNYQYNGKELQDEVMFTTTEGVDIQLGYYDYGARFYDPAIGRWGQVDPLAEGYFSYNSYNYVLNNPLKNIDPDGMRVSLFDNMASQVGSSDIERQQASGEYRSETYKAGERNVNIFVKNLSNLSTQKMLQGISTVFDYFQAGSVSLSTNIPDEKDLGPYQSVAAIGERNSVAKYLQNYTSNTKLKSEFKAWSLNKNRTWWPEVGFQNLIAIDSDQVNEFFIEDSNIYHKIGFFVAHSFGHNGGYIHEPGDRYKYGVMANGEQLQSLTMKTRPSLGNKAYSVQQLCQIYCNQFDNLYIYHRLWKIPPPTK